MYEFDFIIVVIEMRNNNMNETEEKIPGSTTVSPEVLETIIKMTANDTQGVTRLYNSSNASNGVKLKISDGIVNADVYVALDADYNTLDVCNHLQNKIIRAVKEMIGMSVGTLNIHVEDYDYPEIK